MKKNQEDFIALNLRRLYVLMAFLTIIGCNGNHGKTTVVCVGDSITQGARVKNKDKHSYPAQLQNLLGEKYDVVNLGLGGATLVRKGKPTVWDQLPKIEAASPDIVVISLGTNDTCGMGTCGDRKSWEYQDAYERDYMALIDSISILPSRPRIYICAPTPMVLETPGLSNERIAGLTVRKPRLQQLVNRVKNVAQEKNVHFLDLNAPLTNRPELFTEADGVHPNKAGYLAIAHLVFQEITKRIDS